MKQNQDFALDFHATAPLGGEAACYDDLCVAGGRAKKKKVGVQLGGNAWEDQQAPERSSPSEHSSQLEPGLVACASRLQMVGGQGAPRLAPGPPGWG